MVVWIVLAVLLAVAEAFTGTMVLLMLAAGAVGSAIAAGLGVGLLGQVLVFAGVSALSLLVLRPIIRRHALPSATGADERLAVQELEGAPGTVLEQVSTTAGLVRIEGELWSARSFDAAQVIEPGEPVRVIEVRGATVLVWRDEFVDVPDERKTEKS